jgi:hypothetical protein
MQDGRGLAALSYAPCRVQRGDTRLRIDGGYPFSEMVQIRVESAEAAAFPLKLHIPAWATGATVAINGGRSRAAEPGSFYEVNRRWKTGDLLTLRLPMAIRVQRGFAQSISVYRGPLLYALDIPAEWRKLKDRPPTADWEVYPRTAWNYALELKTDAEASFEVRTQRIPSHGTPFRSDAPPVWLEGRARLVEGWGEVKNAAGAPPVSPVTPTGAVKQVRLIPYGAAKLRLSAIPWFNP